LTPPKKLAASTKDLEPAVLCFAADQINDSARFSTSSSKRWVR
jgi:hypothetical protein